MPYLNLHGLIRGLNAAERRDFVGDGAGINTDDAQRFADAEKRGLNRVHKNRLPCRIQYR